MTTLDELLVKLREPTPEMWEAAWTASEDYFVPDQVSKDGLRLALAAFVAPIADALEAAARENERLREQGQAEGMQAVLSWLRERGAMKPRASLWQAAETLADQFEQSRIPARNALSGGPHE